MNYLQAMNEKYNGIEQRNKMLDENISRLSGVSMTLADIMRSTNEELIATNNRVEEIENKVETKIEQDNERIQNAPLDRIEAAELNDAVNAVVTKLCNGKNSPSYKDASIRGKAYGLVWSYVFDAIGLQNRDGEKRKKDYIRHKHVKKAISCLREYAAPAFLVREINEKNKTW